MIKIFSTKQVCPIFKLAETTIHKYSSYPQHIIKEKIINRKDNTAMHRFYLYDKYGGYKEFVCDLITDENGIFARAQNDTIHICDKHGYEYFVYEIRRNK